ncbi:uncharacterized protein F4812DRAFT_356258 [Daldinia caldariorum]|uniref:uncharacterized protein n=1 Tax=Daldinia caldariorum TaxID=326644 RepID=UPI002007DEF1|nr:uncharacterized protein F4812DRAFT_356258 [Daldinia caldariorum]KAI1469050.1 hypothetical protein F4812DRAFT_356258 [Daldinia caldariorum]
MGYEGYISRMTPSDLDNDDTFPERHTLNPTAEFKSQSDAREEHKRENTPTRQIRRRPRRRSESADGYEMRDRYWEAMDIIEQDLTEATKAPAVWDYVYDPVCLPPSGVSKTPAIRRLGSLPIRRAWRRLNSREHPDLGSTGIVEAVMLYERGIILSRQLQCTHCRKSQGVSPGCVVLDTEEEFRGSPDSLSRLRLMCSNCLYDGRQCDVQIQSARNQPSRTPTPSQIKGCSISNPIHLDVLDLIEKMLKSEGAEKEDAATRAKEIEMAALEIAQAAHEWGLGIKDKRRRNIYPTHSTN